MREQDSATRTAVEKLYGQHQIPLSVKLEMSSIEAIKQSVAQGFGLSVLSLHSFTEAEWVSEFAALNVEHFPLHQQWYLIFPRERVLSTIAKIFIDFVLQESSQYCQSYQSASD